MEANPVSIIEYFNGEKQSVIPLFQREYTWSNKNWQALWDDLLTQYDAGLESTHFLGAVVSVPARSVPVGVSKHLIIDGQQRLTTVSILLRALQEFVDERTAARIDDYLINRHQEGADKLKLLPTQSDRSHYIRLVLEKASPSEQSQIEKAFRFFCDRLRGKDLDDEPIDPHRIFQTVGACLQVVMINLGDSDDPYLIFESLNYKGEPLTQADLVRNYVLMRFRHSLEAGGEQERMYYKHWKPLGDSLGEHLTEFLRHYSMKDGENVKRGGVYAAIKQQFSKVDQGALPGALEDLCRHGRFFEAFAHPGTESRSDVEIHLAAFRELDFTTSYPLLLRLFDATDRGTLTRGDLVRALQLIESFNVRRSVCNVPTNALNKLFLSWAKAFRSEGTVQWLAHSMATGAGGRRWPRNDEFAESFTKGRQYLRKHTRYLLLRLEKSFDHKEVVDLSNATIEHVLPRTLSADWAKMLGPDSKPLHAEWVDTFGNLTLTAYNPELGNKSFASKKDLLKDSHVELNRWICRQAEWNIDAIQARAANLFKGAREVWPGPEAFGTG